MKLKWSISVTSLFTRQLSMACAMPIAFLFYNVFHETYIMGVSVETSLHSIPFPLSSSRSIFLPPLRNKSKTKAFPVNLKTVLGVALSELKITNFHHYVQKIMHFLQKHSHFLKLQYLFRAHIIFCRSTTDYLHQ